MSSWLSLGRRTPETGAEEKKVEGSGGGLEAGGGGENPIDPDEVRRRRLERLQAAAEASRLEKEKEEAETAAKLSCPPPPVPGPCPGAPKSKAEPAPPAMEIATPSHSQQDTPPPVPALPVAKMKASDLGTHRLIQRVLQVTADLGDPQGGGLVHVALPTEVEAEGGVALFTLASVSEVICTRLSAHSDGVGGEGSGASLGGFMYLAASYARLEEESRSRRPGVTEEALKEVREEVLNFSVTAVSEPDVFGLSSEEVKAQLVRGLVTMAQDPAALVLPLPFLRQVLARMEEAEIPRVFAPILSDLLIPLTRAARLSDPGAGPHALALLLLLKLHKALPLALVQGVANFLLPAAGVPMPAYNPRMPLLQGPVRLQRNGRAHESFTTLGVLFRLGFPATDPEVYNQFENLQRRSKAEVTGKLNGLRQQLRAHQAALTDLVTALLKAGGPCRSQTVLWIAQALALNLEAEKSRPNEGIKSSDTFLVNVGAVLLGMAGNFVGEEKKRAGIDDGFVRDLAGNAGAYPEDLTRLKPGPEGEGAKEGGGGGEYNFLTQCFFLTGRALHLGLVACVGKHMSEERWLGHLRRQMEAGVEGAEERFNMVLQRYFAQVRGQ